jgi:hypothetical protein
MQRENKWQERFDERFVEMHPMNGNDMNNPPLLYQVPYEDIKDLYLFIQSEIDRAKAEEREKTLREIHDWAYKKGGEIDFEKRQGFKATVDYTKHLIKQII